MKPSEEVKIKLDRDRTIVFDLYSLSRAEREINKQRRDDGLPNTSIFRLINDQVSGVSAMSIDAQVILVLLWAGLLREDSTLTVDQVGVMVANPLRAAAGVLRGIDIYFSRENVEEIEEVSGDLPLAPPTGPH